MEFKCLADWGVFPLSAGEYSLCFSFLVARAVGLVHAKQKRVTFAAACMGWDAIFVVNLRPSELGKYHVMMQVDMHPVSFSDTATLL